MSIPFFLAISAREFPLFSELPPNIAWMSAHFSSSGSGLSNLPQNLPEGSLLILDDQTPWEGHSTEMVCREVVESLLKSKASGLLLDFERPVTPETALLTTALSQCCREIGVMLGAPESYAAEEDTAIFISPLPCQTPPELLYQKNRKLWLDVSAGAYLLHIAALGATGQAADQRSFPDGSYPEFIDPVLHCSYRSRPNAGGIDILLSHSRESIDTLLTALDEQVVQLAIGLYREFR